MERVKYLSSTFPVQAEGGLILEGGIFSSEYSNTNGDKYICVDLNVHTEVDSIQYNAVFIN